MSLDAVKILRKLASFLLFGLSVFPTVAASTMSGVANEPHLSNRADSVDHTARFNSVMVGKFQIQWDAANPFVVVHHVDNADKVLFKTIPSVPFVTVGYATDINTPIVDGNYKINEWTLYETPYQSITASELLDDDTFVIYGEVWGLITRASYELKFFIPQARSSSSKKSGPEKAQLSFHLNVKALAGTFNRVFFNYGCEVTENFYGFGTQFTFWNMKGRRVPLLVAEQGIGRGRPIVTTALNLIGAGAGGDWSTTYAPKPLYITNQNRAMLFENTEMMFIDTRDKNAVVVELWGNELRGRILNGHSMLELITEITSVTGRMKPLPKWTQQGAVVGLEGGTKEVTHLVDRLVKNDVPLSAVWLQDWVGLRHSYDGDRLMWNWQLDESYYPQWDAMVDDWRARHDIRVMTYINPFFSEAQKGDTPLPNGRRNLYREGVEKGYFVQHPKGGAYKLFSGSIEFLMLDTTNPAAREWMKDIIKHDMIEGSRSSGWMADFGEYLPFDAVLHSGEDAALYHNIYPQAWAEINEEAVREAAEEKRRRLASSHGEDLPSEENDVVYFMRSAGLQSPAHTSLFWLGDQLVTWDAHDGIKSVMVGALTGGIGGHSLTHTDIGGYTMHDYGPLTFIRSKELLLRWTELAAFGSALFRTHVGSNTSPLNAQVYADEEVMEHFGIFTRIFAELADYRMQLMNEASEKGWPLIRSMAAHYPKDPISWEVTSQYLFGADFLVAPVLDPASRPSATSSGAARHGSSYSELSSSSSRVPAVKVFLPANSEWVHLWTGQVIRAGSKGRYVSVDAPLGHMPVFYTPNSAAGKKLRAFVVSRGLDVVHLTSLSITEDKSSLASIKSSGPADTSIPPNPLDLSAYSLHANDTESLSPSEVFSECDDAHQSEEFEGRDVYEAMVEQVGFNQLHDVPAVATLHVHLHSEATTTVPTLQPVPMAPTSLRRSARKAVIGDITDFIERTWVQWLGVESYVAYFASLTKFNGHRVGSHSFAHSAVIPYHCTSSFELLAVEVRAEISSSILL